MKFLILAFLLFLLNANPLYAHTSGGKEETTVLMHAEPEDRPLANQKTILHFQIDDVSKEFRMKDCNCTVSVFRDGKKLVSKPADEVHDPKSLYSASTTVTFDREGSYEIRFEGAPITSDQFHPFDTTFKLEVGKSVIEPKNSLGVPSYATYTFLALIGGSTAFLVLKRISS